MSPEELLKDCEKISLGPKDVLMYSTERMLSCNETRRIHQALRHVFPRNEVIIVDQAGKIEVISPQEVPA